MNFDYPDCAFVNITKSRDEHSIRNWMGAAMRQYRHSDNGDMLLWRRRDLKPQNLRRRSRFMCLKRCQANKDVLVLRSWLLPFVPAPKGMDPLKFQFISALKPHCRSDLFQCKLDFRLNYVVYKVSLKSAVCFDQSRRKSTAGFKVLTG